MTCQHCQGESDLPFCTDCFTMVTSPSTYHFDGNDQLVPCPGIAVCPFCEAMSKVMGRMQVVGVDHRNGTITIQTA